MLYLVEVHTTEDGALGEERMKTQASDAQLEEPTPEH